MRTRQGIRWVVAVIGTVVMAGALALVVPAGSADAAVSTAPVCQNNALYPGGKTCVQLVDTGFGSYGMTATATTNNSLSSAWLTLTGASGIPDPSMPAKVAAHGTATWSIGNAAAAGKWCASFSYTLFGVTLTATNSPLPCVTVPPLPALPGTAKQVCLDPTQYPQFETCIDVVNGAVVAKGYSTVGSPAAYLVLTAPGGATTTGPTTKIVAGQVLTLAGPAPAAAGTWCADFYNIFPVVGFPLDVTGKTPVCLTV